jgi:hypothetical protein
MDPRSEFKPRGEERPRRLLGGENTFASAFGVPWASFSVLTEAQLAALRWTIKRL